MMGMGNSTDYIINMILNTESLSQGGLKLNQLQAQLNKTLATSGKDIRATGLTSIWNKADKAYHIMVDLENQITKVTSKAQMKITPGVGVYDPKKLEAMGAVAAPGMKGTGYRYTDTGGMVSQNVLNSTRQAKVEIEKVTNAQGQAAKGADAHGKSLGALASRAMATIPIWLLLRGAYMTVLKAVQDVIKTYLDLETEMGRVATVTRGNAQDLRTLRQEVVSYSMGASKGFKEAASAMYAIGSAGLTVKQQMTGLKHVMDLTIGSFGNTEEIAKLVAGSFNVFGDSLEGATTDFQKFQHIADMLAYTYSCYTPDTEVLTDQGWKLFTELDKTENMATLDLDTFELIYQKPYCYVNQKFEGNLHHIKGKFVDIMVTPNHKLFANMGHKPVHEKFELIEAKDAWGRCKEFYRGCNWLGKNEKYFYLPKVDVNTNSKNIDKIKMEDWLEFLAWYLSEGNCFINGKGTYRVTIHQSHYKEKVESCLNKLPWKYNFDNPNKRNKKQCPTFNIYNKQLALYLQQFGKAHDKYIPKNVKQLSKHLLRIFLKFYAYGDGSISKKDNWAFGIGTSSVRMRDDLHEIALKADYGSTYREGKGGYKNSGIGWKLSFSERDKFKLKSKKNKNNNLKTSNEELIPYKGNVVCVEIPNHVLFIRRNGKSVWCGNTQQVELSEIATAMTYVASVADLVNINFDELVTTIGVLNTGMLKGSKSGTALLNAFVQIANKTERLGDIGVVFDPSKPLDLMNVMTQLHDIYGDQALSLANLKEVMEVFGRRGGRAAAQLIADFDRWKTSIADAKANFEDFAASMKDKAENTLPKAWEKYWNAIKGDMVASLDLSGFTSLLSDSAILILAKHHARIYSDVIENAIPRSDRQVSQGRMPKVFSVEDSKQIIGLVEKFQDVMERFKKSPVGASSHDLKEISKIFKMQDLEKRSVALQKYYATNKQILDIDKERASYEKEMAKIASDVQTGVLKEANVREDLNLLISQNTVLSRIVGDDELKRVKMISILLGLLKDMIAVKKEEATLEDKISIATRRKFEDKFREFKYDKLTAKGLTDEALLRVKIGDLMGKINTDLESLNNLDKQKLMNEEKSLENYKERELLTLADLGNKDKLLLLYEHLGTSQADLTKLMEHVNALSVDNLKIIGETGDKLKTTFQDSFSSFLQGESSLSDIFKNMGASFKEGMADSLSEGLTEGLFNITGMDKMFGGMASSMKYAGQGMTGQIKSAGDYNAKVWYNAITNAGKNLTSGGGSGVIAGGGYGGLTLPGGQQITLPGFGEGGAMGPVNTYAGTTGSGIKYYKTASGAITPQAGGGGMAAGGAIMGFSQYQSASQSGASTGTAVGSGVMTGIGGLGLMAGMAGAFSAGGLASGALPMLAGLGPVGWIAAGALLIGGMIMGNKTPEFRREETKETTKSITSKIDISNKELSWVNRNLVSLRQELTYIMQDSYYFREKDPTEDFAADSQRGTI